MSLPPGVIMDGEAVVYVAADDGSVHISFAAAQSRALSRPRRARELADQHPATYVAFEILAHPAADLPDLRPRPYTERRLVLLDVLADVGPPIVPVWSTTDLDEALLWYTALEGTGVEGIVAKPLKSAYTAGRIWSKVRNRRNCIKRNTQQAAVQRFVLVSAPAAGRVWDHS
ncbi:ATP-dependent DNA ligase [Streptomyces sp. NPDC002092]